MSCFLVGAWCSAFGADDASSSYPRWGKKRNTVTLVGRNKEYMDGLISEVEKGVQGRRVSREDEDD